MKEVEIVELNKKIHNRKNFDCGVLPLNDFLKKEAGQHSLKGLSKTYVAVKEDHPNLILGYFTLLFSELDSSILPPELGKGLLRKIPVIKLGRLAIRKESQGKGLGSFLLIEFILLTLEAFEKIGGVGVWVDAKNEKVKEFYLSYGFVPIPGNPLGLFLPLKAMKEIKKIAIK